MKSMRYSRKVTLNILLLLLNSTISSVKTEEYSAYRTMKSALILAENNTSSEDGSILTGGSQKVKKSEQK